jgi:hypothetical protein
MKAFRSNLVPKSSVFKLVMPTRTLSSPSHVIRLSGSHRKTATAELCDGGIWCKSIRREKKGVWRRAQPLHGGFIAYRDGKPTFDGFRELSACC